MHGQFVWYELTTPDPDASKRFYQPLIGWSTQPFDNDYSMWTNGGQPIGGIFRLGPEQKAQGIPPNWLPYVEVNNVDESARLASSFGGTTVVPPTDVPNTGRFAVLQDPQGATFGIYKSATKSDAWDGTTRLGRFSWHELMTTDYKSAYEFYRKLFGWAKTNDFDMGPGVGMYQMYGLKGKDYGGMFNRPPEMAQVPPFWLPYIYVKDVKSSTEAAKRSGAEVVNGPMEVPDGTWIVILKDPTGAAIALHSGTPKAKPAEPAKASKPKATAKAKKANKKANKKADKKANKKAGKKAGKKAKPKKKAKKKSRR